MKCAIGVLNSKFHIIRATLCGSIQGGANLGNIIYKDCTLPLLEARTGPGGVQPKQVRDS